MTVKGRITIEIEDDGRVRYLPDPALSRLEIHGAVLEIWRLLVGVVDLGWYRTLRREEEMDEAARETVRSEERRP